MKIEAEEYVRTDKGTIAKAISNPYEYKDDYKQDFDNDILNDWYCDETIIAHSKNIKKLIEVGDYVNGRLITDIVIYYVNDEEIVYFIFDEKSIKCGDYSRGAFKDSEIKSIVTKEQFNQVKYEV